MKIDRFSIKPGDTVSVHLRGQPAFVGIVIARHGGESPSATFVARTTLSGIGVEKIYPLHSPLITKIEIKKRGKVRRAKLYYLRKKIGKEAKLKEARKSEKKEETGQKTKTKQKTENSKDR